MALIDRLSLCSVYLAIFGEGGEQIGHGTGFIVDGQHGPTLITARHCVTGRHQETGELLDKKFASIPKKITIRHHHITKVHHFGESQVGGGLIGIISQAILYDENGSPLWLEHPKYRCLIDAVAIPICPPAEDATVHIDLEYCKLHFREKQNIDMADIRLQILPAETISVIGYPFGMFTDSTLPIWATGYIASEPNVKDTFGVLYIDCRGRPGQSGAPVFAKRFGELLTNDRRHISFFGEADCFIGIYVGRVNNESDIGIVHRAEILKDIALRGAIGHDCKLSPCENCRIKP